MSRHGVPCHDIIVGFVAINLKMFHSLPQHVPKLNATISKLEILVVSLTKIL